MAAASAIAAEEEEENEAGGRVANSYKLPRNKKIVENETLLSEILHILEATGAAHCPYANEGWREAFNRVYSGVGVAAHCNRSLGTKRSILRFKDKMVELWNFLEQQQMSAMLYGGGSTQSSTSTCSLSSNPLYTLALKQLTTYRRATNANLDANADANADAKANANPTTTALPSPPSPAPRSVPNSDPNPAPSSPAHSPVPILPASNPVPTSTTGRSPAALLDRNNDDITVVEILLRQVVNRLDRLERLAVEAWIPSPGGSTLSILPLPLQQLHTLYIQSKSSALFHSSSSFTSTSLLHSVYEAAVHDFLRTTDANLRLIRMEHSSHPNPSSVRAAVESPTSSSPSSNARITDMLFETLQQVRLLLQTHPPLPRTTTTMKNNAFEPESSTAAACATHEKHNKVKGKDEEIDEPAAAAAVVPLSIAIRSTYDALLNTYVQHVNKPIMFITTETTNSNHKKRSAEKPEYSITKKGCRSSGEEMRDRGRG